MKSKTRNHQRNIFVRPAAREIQESQAVLGFGNTMKSYFRDERSDITLYGGEKRANIISILLPQAEIKRAFFTEIHHFLNRWKWDRMIFFPSRSNKILFGNSTKAYFHPGNILLNSPQKDGPRPTSFCKQKSIKRQHHTISDKETWFPRFENIFFLNYPLLRFLEQTASHFHSWQESDNSKNMKTIQRKKKRKQSQYELSNRSGQRMHVSSSPDRLTNSDR